MRDTIAIFIIEYKTSDHHITLHGPQTRISIINPYLLLSYLDFFSYIHTTHWKNHIHYWKFFWLNIIAHFANKCTYFQCKYAMQLSVLNQLYPNHFHLFHADKRFCLLLLRASGLGLISSMRSDSGKGIHRFVKSAWSILHSQLKTASYPL